MDVQFRNPDWSTNKVMQHCRTLKRLLQMLPLTNPSEDELLEILKTNVKLFAAFVEQETRTLIRDIELNQLRIKSSEWAASSSKSTEDGASSTNSGTETAQEQEMAESKPREENQANETLQSPMPISVVVSSGPREVLPSSSLQEASKLSKVPKKVKSSIKTTVNPSKGLFITKFGIGPKAILPFYPTNLYPYGLPICNYQAKRMSSNALFVYRIMMMGEGYLFNIAKKVETMNKSKYSLDSRLYDERLTISALARSLTRFDQLPKSVLLCIGNTDIARKEPYDTIRHNYRRLIHVLRLKTVKQLYVLPIMDFEGMSENELRKQVASMLEDDWSKDLKGEYVHLQEFVDAFVEPPKVENDKLCFTSKQCKKIALALRRYFEPSKSGNKLKSISEKDAKT